MTDLCLVTQSYFDANEALIRSIWAQAEPGANIQPIAAEGGLLRCRCLDPSLLPNADVYELPAPLQDEGNAGYRARIAVAAVGAFNAVKNGPKEVFHMPDERRLFDCWAVTGWPEQPTA